MYCIMSANEKLMQILYYSPGTQYTSIKELYDNLKNKGVTYNEVKNFVQNQESNQLFRKQKRIKHYFPISAKHKFEILQLDLIDLSNLASANENYRYLVVAVDVFSRLAYVVPIKNKRADTITDALDEIIGKTEPSTINSDQEFTSHIIQKFLKERGIDTQAVDVGDHHKLGIVDRFCRTLREKINKYMAMYNTTKYIDVLPKIVFNYNHSYHSGIKKKPVEVDDEDAEVLEITNKKFEKAKKEEIKFEVGEKVRFMLNRPQFEKGTLPKWSKVIHKIVSKNYHSYVLDNDKTYKYYELQRVGDVQKLEKPTTEPTREQMKKDITVKRRQNKEGIEKSNIVAEKRPRKQTDKFHY